MSPNQNDTDGGGGARGYKLPVALLPCGAGADTPGLLGFKPCMFRPLLESHRV